MMTCVTEAVLHLCIFAVDVCDTRSRRRHGLNLARSLLVDQCVIIIYNIYLSLFLIIFFTIQRYLLYFFLFVI